LPILYVPRRRSAPDFSPDKEKGRALTISMPLIATKV
jgi:hypothetical protein